MACKPKASPPKPANKSAGKSAPFTPSKPSVPLKKGKTPKGAMD